MDAETRRGRLKIYRFGRLVRIDIRDLEEYIRQAREHQCCDTASAGAEQ